MRAVSREPAKGGIPVELSSYQPLDKIQTQQEILFEIKQQLLFVYWIYNTICGIVCMEKVFLLYLKKNPFKDQ